MYAKINMEIITQLKTSYDWDIFGAFKFLNSRKLLPLYKQVQVTKSPSKNKGLSQVRPGGFEPPTFWSVARRSIQLSYGRMYNQ